MNEDFIAMMRDGTGASGEARAAPRVIEVKPVRTGRRNGEYASDVPRIPRVDNDDLGRIGDVHVKDLGIRIVYRPAGPAGHADLG